jgi:large subunit ribosomal protein L19e
MAKLETQKRLAAAILNVGINRVWLDPARLEDIAQAITRADILQLIKEGAIKARAVKGKVRKKQRKKRGPGRIRKKVVNRKQRYVKLIRKLREYLNELKGKGIISKKEKSYFRRLAKAGYFKSLRHLKEYVRKAALETKETEKEKAETKEKKETKKKEKQQTKEGK